MHRRSDAHADVFKELADTLMELYSSSQSVSTLEEAIILYERTLEIRARGHETYGIAVRDLGNALYQLCFEHEGDDTRARRCIQLLREALLFCPPGHALRDRALHDLAKVLLYLTFEQGQGSQDVVTEAILLNRQALALRPPGHPVRPASLNNLANALWRSFEASGDLRTLAEAIDMQREAVGARPPGHPSRATSLISLGNILFISFQHQGRLELLAEAISLLREAVVLCKVGHPYRFMALDNLAIALLLRFRHLGDHTAMPEAISLQREALHLIPETHPGRARMMCSLAETLLASFRERADAHHLAEAQTLFRAALSLTPPGNTFHSEMLTLLAEALLADFDVDGNAQALTEAIQLQRKGLELRPGGHWKRLASLENLAQMLCRAECLSWPEAHALYSEALEICPRGYPTRARLLSGMSTCFLDPRSPFFSPQEGIRQLSEAYSDDSCAANQRLRSAVSDLQRVENACGVNAQPLNDTFDNPRSNPVLGLYMQVIGLLPRAANFGLDHNSRLQAVAGTDEIARNAAARAFGMQCHSQAIEMLEEGRGVFWAQALHLRSTGTDGVPDGDREELLQLLRLLDHGAHRLETSEKAQVQLERELETRRQLNDQAEALISKIRGYPGLDRFLLPPAFDVIFAALPEGFVSVVNASKIGYHALLLHRATGLVTSIELKPPHTGFDSSTLRAHIPRDSGAHTGHGSERGVRAMRLVGGQKGSFEDVLNVLWSSIVEPVIKNLGLKVCHPFFRRYS
jgi:tetratricopeptide (TPR) repeat protein